MKKSIALIVIILFIVPLSLAACTRNPVTDKSSGSLPPVTSEPTPEVETTPDVETAPDATQVPDATPTLDVEAAPDATSAPDVKPTSDITPTPDVKPAPGDDKKNEFENTVFSVKTQAEAAKILADGLAIFADKIQLDLSQAKLKSSEIQMLVQNAYFDVLSNNPLLKYAYDMRQEITSSKAICTISYMPYKLGKIDESKLPAGAYKIYTLKDLITAANKSIGKDKFPIAIMNSDLNVDDMQNALGQAGYSYIVFMLNNDATQIMASPTNQRTMAECVDYINKTKALAQEIYSKIITDKMTDDEKVEAIYKYITSTVTYDYRYYNAPDTMPYESTTAYGAYKYQTAICGGNSWSVKMLLDIAGIENYNVAGIMYTGEYHMWNMIKYKGKFQYFDATWDLGATSEIYYRNFAKTAEEFKPDHQWDNEFYTKFQR